MKDFFASWARQHGVPIEDNWTVEQICDAIVGRKLPWPDELVNEQGWQLWTATLRYDLGVKSIKWDEVSASDSDPEIEIVFTLSAKRQWKAKIARNLLRSEDFGRVCAMLERSLREWNTTDLAEREAAMAAAAREWTERAPDLMDHVVGYRAWNLDGSRIKPIGMGEDVWEGGKEVRATCTHGHMHIAPDPDCECGLYAWHSFEQVRGGARGDQVFGAVQAWGHIEVHGTGFRAEYMRPVMLAYDDSDDRMQMGGPNDGLRTYGADYFRVKKIAETLGGELKVVGFSEFQRAGEKFGLTLSPGTPDLFPPTDGFPPDE